ncbi:recombinase family protein [Agrobacterium sp. O3.4]|uniref:Recombinase family protein n=1 Tax=Agrobacterium cucumeris TaxID=2862866 RepID=A0ABY8RIV3_9HYPH|nr:MULTISPECIES: recombinase family protein [Rhizobium/Agrobacterium group]MCZ7469809.1 recombinase family protein [Rhizobium rhizogenes]WHO06962.1 recombinase family protein [Agrobacterium cucumeris]
MPHTPVTPRLIGYARVSTEAQDLAYQIERLENAGCVEIFHEKRSGKNRDGRPELARLLARLQPGDVMLATATDRVARDPLDLVNILKTVKDAGAGLRLLDEPFIDTTSEMADLIAFLVGWAARWQRRRILENTAQGREAARLRGVKFGRPCKLGPREREKIAEQRAQGETCGRIARAFGVSESTIHRAV